MSGRAEGYDKLLDAAMTAHAVLMGTSINLHRQTQADLHEIEHRIQTARDYLRAGIQGTLHPLSDEEREMVERRAPSSVVSRPDEGDASDG